MKELQSAPSRYSQEWMPILISTNYRAPSEIKSRQFFGGNGLGHATVPRGVGMDIIRFEGARCRYSGQCPLFDGNRQLLSNFSVHGRCRERDNPGLRARNEHNSHFFLWAKRTISLMLLAACCWFKRLEPVVAAMAQQQKSRFFPLQNLRQA